MTARTDSIKLWSTPYRLVLTVQLHVKLVIPIKMIVKLVSLDFIKKEMQMSVSRSVNLGNLGMIMVFVNYVTIIV